MKRRGQAGRRRYGKSRKLKVSSGRVAPGRAGFRLS